MTTTPSRVMHMAHIFARQGMNKSYALTWAWHMQTLRKALLNGIVRFRFIKINGDVRDAKGTLHPLLIPEDKTPKGTSTATPNFSSMPFFDLDKQEWRAFRITEFDEVLEAYALTEIML